MLLFHNGDIVMYLTHVIEQRELVKIGLRPNEYMKKCHAQYQDMGLMVSGITETMDGLDTYIVQFEFLVDDRFAVSVKGLR